MAGKGGGDKEVRNSFIDQIQRRHCFASSSTFICDDEHALISGVFCSRGTQMAAPGNLYPLQGNSPVLGLLTKYVKTIQAPALSMAYRAYRAQLCTTFFCKSLAL